ncbi:reverse transcriptase domain-containing protein [Tanacetum coccineum]
MFPSLTTSSGTEGSLVIEVEIGGHTIHRMYVDGGSSTEVLYEHCFNRLWLEIKNQMVPATTSLTGFSGETIWPLGQLRLLETIGDANYSTKAWMNFMIVRSLSLYNGIIGRPGRPGITRNPSVAIGGTLSAIGRMKLCSLLKENLDIFAWQPSDMTGVPRSIVEHRLNIREGYSPVRQKKRGQAPKCAKAIQTEVQKLVEAGIIREVYYHEWLSNLIMVKKHVGSWRMNIEVYVDDLVIKSQTEAEMLRDIDETFRTLRKINMKLNPKKCTFGAVEGMFLGYMISPKGIKPCPDKTEVVLQLPSPRTIKEVQSLNGKLASLNRFLSKSAERSLPLFKTLKKCIKKSNFHWTSEAEQAFKQLKQHLSELPLLVAPKSKEELIGPELNYTPMEKLVLSLVFAAKRLRRSSGSSCVEKPGRNSVSDTLVVEKTPAGAHGHLHGTDHSCVEDPALWLNTYKAGGYEVYLSDSKLVANQVLGAYVAKEENMIKYLEKVKSMVLVEILKEKSIQEKEVTTVVEEDGPTWMAPIIEYLKEGTLPDDRKAASKLRIKARQYERLEGVLYRRSFLKPWLSMQARPQSMPLTPITAPWPFYKWGIDIAGPFPKGPGKVKFLIVAMDYFTKWIEAKAVATITGNQVKKFMWDNIVCRFGLPGEIVSDNEAVIPVEIGMPTYGTAAVDATDNDAELRLNLDLLKERRERAAIRKAKAKLQMTKYYNARIRGVTFRPGDFVYRSNDASHAVAGGKLSPKWEGPYEVTESLGNGAYRLRSMDGTILTRTWNIANLKKCYL